jgi:hypothetical protein
MEYLGASILLLTLFAGGLAGWISHKQWKLYNKLDRNIDRNVLILKKMENVIELASLNTRVITE